MPERGILLIIVLLGFIFRFANLNNVPPSLSHDEVAIGYNAYSILQTGRDEYGKPFPLLFRSFDDYKLPGMVYASIPTIALFGLNEWGVRIPSALFGSLMIVVLYFLSKKLMRASLFTVHFSLFTAFLLAINPWSINFSRQSFESNGATFFFLLGVALLLAWERKPWLLLPSALSFATSIYFYYSTRVALPFVLLAFLFVYRKNLGKHLGAILTAGAVGFFALLPLTPSLLSPEGLARIGMVSVINDPAYRTRLDEWSQKIAESPTIFNRIVYNRRLALVATIAQNYGENIYPSHLFSTGTRGYGLFHPIEAIFLLIGLATLWKIKDPRKWIVAAWLFASPLVGALTVQQPNSLRTLIGAPAFVLISGLGATVLFERLKRQKFFLGIVGFILALQMASFLKSYFVTMPAENALAFGDGYKQMVGYVSSQDANYDAVYITGEYWRPYIFLLFWQRYDPHQYQKSGHPSAFGKYVFGKALWDMAGISFGDYDFPSAISKTRQPTTLVIFSKREWEKQKNHFVPRATVNGRFTPGVFVAASFP